MHHLLLHIIVIFSFLIFININALQDMMQHPNWKLLKHELCGMSLGAYTADRIIGGHDAILGAYPWIARIGYRDILSRESGISYDCGGTLINQLYIVTAAHCVVELPDEYIISSILLGEHNTATNPDCEDNDCAEPVQDFEPAKIISHEDYNSPPFQNDIAIIRLNKPVEYNEFVVPICMVKDELLTKNFVGQKAEVAGWGIYDIDDPKSSTILQKIQLPVVENERCKRAFRKYADIGEKQICVGGNTGKDSCSGDSGGPLMKVENIDGSLKYYLIGIVSFGVIHCGRTATPAVYSKVSGYLEWILDNLSP